MRLPVSSNKAKSLDLMSSGSLPNFKLTFQSIWPANQIWLISGNLENRLSVLFCFVFLNDFQKVHLPLWGCATFL